MFLNVHHWVVAYRLTVVFVTLHVVAIGSMPAIFPISFPKGHGCCVDEGLDLARLSVVLSLLPPPPTSEYRVINVPINKF